MYNFAGMKATVMFIIPNLAFVRDRFAYLQLNTIPEKTHSCC
jgi:hypothetical protein